MPPDGKRRFVVGGAALLLQFCMGLTFLSVAPLFPLIMETYSIPRATASLLVGVGSLVLAVSLVPASVLVARLGPRRGMAAGGVLMAAIVLSPLADGFALLLATRVSFALGSAMLLAAFPLVVMAWFPQKEFGVMLGLNVVSQSLGVTTAMVGATAMANLVGWQGALFAIGLLTCGAVGLWMSLARRPTSPRAEAPAAIRGADGLRGALTHRTTLLLGFGMLGAVGAFVTFTSWLPTYYHEQFGFSLQQAGVIGGIVAAFGIVGALLGSVLPYRFQARRPFLVAGGVMMSVGAAGCFLTESLPIIYPSAALLGVAGWLYFPVVMTIPLEMPGIRPEKAAMMVASVLGIGNISGFIAPLIVGLSRDISGDFRLGLAACALLPLTLAASALWLRNGAEVGPENLDNDGSMLELGVGTEPLLP